MIARSIGLGLSIVALTACAARIAARHTVPCDTGRWSTPRSLMVGADGLVHVETPQIVQTRGGLVFFGDNAVVLTVTDSGFGRIAGWPRGPGMLAGVIRRPDGRIEPVPLPHYLRSFVAVRAVGDLRGNAHVFWGESPDTTIDQSEHLRGVWYARFDGTKWSQPERVFEDSSMRWYVVFNSIAAVGNDVHLVVTAGHLPDNYVIHVRRTAGGRRHLTAALSHRARHSDLR